MNEGSELLLSLAYVSFDVADHLEVCTEQALVLETQKKQTTESLPENGAGIIYWDLYFENKKFTFKKRSIEFERFFIFLSLSL